MKTHTLLDLRGSIPSFIEVSDGKRHDVHLLDEIIPEPGASYVMDRAYLDFKRLHAFHRSGAFFVTRTKAGVVLNRRYSHTVPVGTGITSDQTVVVGTADSLKNYPDTFRRVRFVDSENNRNFIFLTNNFELPALTIAQFYKSRWRVELFFKSNSIYVSRRFTASVRMPLRLRSGCRRHRCLNRHPQEEVTSECLAA